MKQKLFTKINPWSVESDNEPGISNLAIGLFVLANSLFLVCLISGVIKNSGAELQATNSKFSAAQISPAQ